MIVRMAHWNCREEFRGEDVKLFNEGAVPIMRGKAGFVQAFLLAEEGTGKRIALTVWTDREKYEAFACSPELDEITNMFAHMYYNDRRPEAAEFAVRGCGFCKSMFKL